MKFIQPISLPVPTAPASQAVLVDGWLHVSGKTGRDAQGMVVGVGDVAAQTEQALINLTACMEAAGGSLANTVKLVVYLKRIDDRPIVNEVRRRFFGDHRPAGTLVEVSALGHPDLLIEIDAVAFLGR